MTVKFSIDLHGMYPMSEYVRLAKLAEDYDFDEIHIVDDLSFKPTWPILALIAANTKRIKMGPWLVSPRIVHPAYHAANLAEIDEISDGRAVIAVGRGGFMELLGIGEPEKPLTMVRETIGIIRHLLAGKQEAFEGQVFKARHDMAFRFQPVRSQIPILLGTFGPQTAKMAGKLADGLLVSCLADSDCYRSLAESFDSGATEAGRDSQVLEKAASPICCISSNRELSFDIMRRMLPNMLQHLYPLTEHAGIKAENIPHKDFSMDDMDPSKPPPDIGLTEKHIQFFSFAGTVNDVIPQVEGLIDAGANHIAFGGMLGPDVDEAMKSIATEIVPRFR